MSLRADHKHRDPRYILARDRGSWVYGLLAVAMMLAGMVEMGGVM